MIACKTHIAIGSSAQDTAKGHGALTDNKLIENHIDYALILPWNFKSEIMKNLKEFKKSGGRFIIPLPKIQIV